MAYFNLVLRHSSIVSRRARQISENIQKTSRDKTQSFLNVIYYRGLELAQSCNTDAYYVGKSVSFSWRQETG